MIRKNSYQTLFLCSYFVMGLVIWQQTSWRVNTEANPPIPLSLSEKLRQGVPACDASPNIGIEQLRQQSEDLRRIEAEWRRIWFTDNDPATGFERVRGGFQ
jgi:hypothetical protein